MYSNTPFVVTSVPYARSFLSSLSPIAGLVGLAVIYVVNTIVRGILTRRKLPPGPPGVPILGNIWDVKGKAWLQYTEWARTYGPIFSLNMAGQPIVVLNSHKVTADLFGALLPAPHFSIAEAHTFRVDGAPTDRKSNIYSDRPNFTMASQIMTQGLFDALGRWHDPVYARSP